MKSHRLAPLAVTLATLTLHDLALAAPPVPNKGDTAWMLVSTALVTHYLK